MLVQNFLRSVAKNDSSVILEGRLSVTTGLISFMMVYISILVHTESNSVQVSVSWFSCIKKCHHQFSDEFHLEVRSDSTSVFFSCSKLFSSKMVSVENLLVKEGLVKKQLTMRFATKFWLCNLSRNLFLKMSDLDHLKVSHRKYWFDFGLHINNQTPYILRKIWFKYQPVGFRIKFWTFFGIYFFLGFSRFAMSFFSLTTGLISSLKSQWKTSLLWRSIRSRNHRNWSLHQNHFGPNFPEICY